MEDLGYMLDNYWEKYGRPFTDEEVEWHRLWFEFLKLTDTQKWSEEVTKDFGDVSGEFSEWWPKHSYLFNRLKDISIKEIKTKFDYQGCKADASGDSESPSPIILGVYLEKSKAELRSAFEEILTKYHKGSAGRPTFDGYGNLYSLHSRPDTGMLNKILAVYKVYSADQVNSKEKRMKLWEIEEEVSKTLTLIIKEKPLDGEVGPTPKLKWTTKNPDKMTIEERRRAQHSTIRKYINYAEEILGNVIYGNFPMYKGVYSKIQENWDNPTEFDVHKYIRVLSGNEDD